MEGLVQQLWFNIFFIHYNGLLAKIKQEFKEKSHNLKWEREREIKKEKK